MEKIRSPNDGKAIWKPGIDEIAKASRGIATWTPQGSLLQRLIF